MTRAEYVKEKYEPELTKIPGVEGVLVQDGALVVLVRSKDVKVPEEIEGIPVRKEVVGDVTILD